MPADDASDLEARADGRGDLGGATTLYTVTVTSPGSGRVQQVQVSARSAESAFPLACAWYPLLPLTGADVEVVPVGPASATPAAGEPAPPAPTAGEPATVTPATAGPAAPRPA